MFLFDEIGSEYWSADIKVGLDNTINGAVYTASGRSAQSLIIDSLNIKKGSALLPAYTCQHIVEPFDWNGWDVDFYNIDGDLHINMESLAKKLRKQPSCIIVESYYGFNTAGNAAELIREAQNGGCIVIEDITHSFLSAFQTSYPDADFRFCSLRKWSGISDGGFAVSLCGTELKKPTVSMDRFSSERHAARDLKDNYRKTGEKWLKEEFLRLYASSEAVLDADIGVYGISSCGYEDFCRLNFEFIAHQRRVNYSYLLKNIRSNYVKVIFNDVCDGDVPIMFPVFISAKRQELRQHLIDERIYCPIHWPMPVQLDDEVIKNNRWIYDTILSIPCDQRYTPASLERMVNLINNFEG